MAPILALVLDYFYRRAPIPAAWAIKPRSEGGSYQVLESSPGVVEDTFGGVDDGDARGSSGFFEAARHTATLKNLSVWAYLAMGFVILVVAVVMVYAMYSCWGSNVVRVKAREGGGVVCEQKETGRGRCGYEYPPGLTKPGFDSFDIPFAGPGSVGDPKLSPVMGSIIRPAPAARRQ